jgi:hypothetical protein
MPQAARPTIFARGSADFAAEFVLWPAGQPSQTGETHGNRPEDPAPEQGAPPSLTLTARCKAFREVLTARSLLLPRDRPVPQYLGQPQFLRLPSIEDRLDEFGCQARERQEPADIGVRHALLLRKIGDRLRAAALDLAPPAMRSNQRLDQGLVSTQLLR